MVGFYSAVDNFNDLGYTRFHQWLKDQGYVERPGLTKNDLQKGDVVLFGTLHAVFATGPDETYGYSILFKGYVNRVGKQRGVTGVLQQEKLTLKRAKEMEAACPKKDGVCTEWKNFYPGATVDTVRLITCASRRRRSAILTGASTSATERAISMSSSVWPKSSGRISWLEAASTVSREMGPTRFPMRWMGDSSEYVLTKWSTFY